MAIRGGPESQSAQTLNAARSFSDTVLVFLKHPQQCLDTVQKIRTTYEKLSKVLINLGNAVTIAKQSPHFKSEIARSSFLKQAEELIQAATLEQQHLRQLEDELQPLPSSSPQELSFSLDLDPAIAQRAFYITLAALVYFAYLGVLSVF